MLDALVGAIAMLLALSMLLSVIQLTAKTSYFFERDVCDTFYTSMKIRLDEETWHWQSETKIFNTHSIIELVNGDIIKRSHQGGYEYLGSCQTVKFEKRGEDVAIVFERMGSKSEKAVYSLTKKKA